MSRTCFRAASLSRRAHAVRRALQFGSGGGLGDPGRSAARRGRPEFERLEERALLAISSPGGMGPFAHVLTASLQGPTTFDVQQGLSSSTVDRGDYYWADGQKISLLRSLDEVAVGLRAGSNPGVFDTLTAAGGPLAGFATAESIGNGLRVFTRSTQVMAQVSAGPVAPGSTPAATVDARLASAESLAPVSWADPVFFDSETGSRLVVDDEVIVSLKLGVDPTTFFAGAYAGYHRLVGTPDQYVATLARGGGADTLAKANLLGSDPRVNWASPNFYQDFRTYLTPNDTLYGSQWHLNNTGQSGATAGADAHLPAAWDTTTGSDKIVIAVLDNGVQTDHPDLAANIFVNAGETPGNGIDDDGNGYIDDVNGWDFVDNDNDANPATAHDNHGTAVAGVAAAVGGNSLGVTGASMHAKILPVKISKDPDGNGGGFVDDATIASAVYYAAGRTANGLGTWRGADILNNSWGGGAPNAVLTAAFNWASTNGRGGRGATSFVASGNAASGYKNYKVTGIPAGDWIFEWRYTKDASAKAGGDTAWLANVAFPDGTRQRFDAAGMPAGWSSPSAVKWSIVNDPSHAYGTGRYEAKAGVIGDSKTTTLRSPTITVAAASDMTYSAWVSSEANFDTLGFYASNDGGATFLGPIFTSSGVPNTTSAVSYPASLPSVVAVGASTDWDYRSDYSQYGSTLDLVAPSSGGNHRIVTTDRTGADGYDPGDYTSTGDTGFGGTSSATPLTAGIAALMLSKNPGLNPTQILQILRATADKIGRVTYSSIQSNPYYGFGRVNAAAALAAVSAPDLAWPATGALTVPASTDTRTAFVPKRSYTIAKVAPIYDFKIAYYASTNTTFGDADDVLLGTETITSAQDKKVGNHVGNGPALTFPDAGTHYLFAKIDDGDVVFESNEGNNVSAPSPASEVSLALVDNGHPGYSETGTWATSTGGYGGNFRYLNGQGASSPTATATWQVAGLAAGYYEVQATWVPGATRTTSAVYRIYDGTTLLEEVPVNQRMAPTGTTVGGVTFQMLSQVLIESGTLMVVLGDDTTGRVVADAVRLVAVSAPALSLPTTVAGGRADLGEAVTPSTSAVGAAGVDSLKLVPAGGLTGLLASPFGLIAEPATASANLVDAALSQWSESDRVRNPLRPRRRLPN